MNRTIDRVVRGMPTSDGAGVKLTRVIGTPTLRRLDPFLMLDEFRSDEPQDYLAGFPNHPHRGFETVTYMIAGRFKHRDNKGHEGLLEAGGAQWMTAGRGIVHSEMPEQEEGLVWGFQLWLNLPARDKMIAPSYKDLHDKDIPVVIEDSGARLRLLAGRIGETKGAMDVGDRVTDPLYVDVEIPAGASVTVPVPKTHEGFVYVFDGESLDIEGKTLKRGELGVLAEGEALVLRATKGKARALVIAGKPIGETVAQYGPFVMNTREELEQAVADFQAGRF